MGTGVPGIRFVLSRRCGVGRGLFSKRCLTASDDISLATPRCKVGGEMWFVWGFLVCLFCFVFLSWAYLSSFCNEEGRENKFWTHAPTRTLVLLAGEDEAVLLFLFPTCSGVYQFLKVRTVLRFPAFFFLLCNFEL